jgi:CheY-like chemotaxis protein
MEEQQQQLMMSEQELKIQNESLEQTKKEIEEKAKELELSSKYKSEFLANMSHELRTPLNSIILLSNLLGMNKNKNLKKTDVDKANVINTSGNELLRLINDILDLSKIESGKMEVSVDEFKSSEMLAELEELFSVVAQDKGVEFKVVDQYNGVITSDKNKISQIIRNLLSNAFKFTKEGSVTVKFEHSQDAKRPVAFSVIDTGLGIPAEKQALIFEAFQQADGSTSRQYGGTGLGLSITKELTRLLGGAVSLSSNGEGHGSCFRIEIPNLEYKNTDEKPVIPFQNEEQNKQVTTQQTTANEIIDNRDNLSKDAETFLVVEDDKGFAKILSENINEKGYNALISLSGSDAINVIKEYNVKGIVLDLGLPDMDGLDLLKMIKSDEKTKDIPVHIISGRDSQESFFQIGAIGYSQKPIQPDDIESVIVNLSSEFKEKNIKKLLIVSNDTNESNELRDSLSDDIEITTLFNSKDAIKSIKENSYNTVVIDIDTDTTTYEVCEFIKHNYPKLPIVIYTKKALSSDESDSLREYTDSIIIKTNNSQERMLKEVDLFLHKLDSADDNVIEDEDIHNDVDLSGMSVLVVDDDIKNIYVLDSLLSEYGADIEVAKNGKEAIDAIHSNEKIDIVLMDIMMPVMNGYEAMTHIRQDDAIKNIPIIAVTAKAMKEDRDKCIEAGADDYLSKPLDPQKLLGMIKIWSEKKHR